MITVIYSQAAENDLIEIYIYSVDNFGQRHADQYESGLKRRLSQLINNPKMGVDLFEIGIGLRKLVYRSHVIYYAFSGEMLIIRRILDARQDPIRHL